MESKSSGFQDPADSKRFKTAIAVFVTWLLVSVSIDVVLFLHRKLGMGVLDGILYFVTILFFLGIGWAIYFKFCFAGKSDTSDTTNRGN